MEKQKTYLLGRLLLLQDNINWSHYFVREKSTNKIRFCYMDNGKHVFVIDAPNDLLGRFDYANPPEAFEPLIKPIMVSDTEKIHEGDLYFNEIGNEISELKKSNWISRLFKTEPDLFYCKKILAMPENFSPEHIKDIIDSKISDGDILFIENEELSDREYLSNHWIKCR